jgi:putative acetyltransferase
LLPLNIRPEQPADLPAIRALVTVAFGQAAEADLVDRLRAAGALAHSLVAEQNGAIVGHIALSPVSVQGAFMPGVLGLAPLAVDPQHQRRGIGAALVEAALASGRAEAAKLVVVLGEPAYYRRFGFRPAAGLGLTCPWPETGEAFQALVLAPPAPRGLVRYHRAFEVMATP